MQYHLALVKKDTNLFQDTISFKENYSKGNSQLPIILMKVEGRMCNMLLDTGANINILNEDVFTEINKNNQIKVSQPEKTITVGSGQMDGVLIANLNFTHKRLKFTEEFDIVNVNEAFNQINKETGVKIDGLLGNEFFKKNQWNLDFDKMVVWVK